MRAYDLSKLKDLKRYLIKECEVDKSDLEAVTQLEQRLAEAEKVVSEFIENEAFMRQVHQPKKMENESMPISFDVWQQFYLAGKRARQYQQKYGVKG